MNALIALKNDVVILKKSGLMETDLNEDEALRMKKKRVLVESGAGAHFSAAAATCSKFELPILGVMGQTDVDKVNTNIIKAQGNSNIA